MAHLETIQCKDVPFAVHRDNNWRNDLANRLVETAQIPVLRVWESSTRRHDWYSRRCESGYCDRFGPCMHYCNPGAVTQWKCVPTLVRVACCVVGSTFGPGRPTEFGVPCAGVLRAFFLKGRRDRPAGCWINCLVFRR